MIHLLNYFKHQSLHTKTIYLINFSLLSICFLWVMHDLSVFKFSVYKILLVQRVLSNARAGWSSSAHPTLPRLQLSSGLVSRLLTCHSLLRPCQLALKVVELAQGKKYIIIIDIFSSAVYMGSDEMGMPVAAFQS